MKNKLILIVLGMFLISLVSAVGVSYCCEKTKAGAECQNTEQTNCDAAFRSAPTSCESTAYCKLGCCYDSTEGVCMKNTPQITCQKNKGVWQDSASCEVPQCELGCCLIGDQAAFVSKQRCKRLSSIYNLEINFRTDVSNEIQCILSTTSDIKGACVFEKEFETNCKFITKDECFKSGETNVSFHENFLCTADELGTVCAKTEKTTCVEGRDEAFFVDSCGNVANIYDASKIKDPNYWKEVVTKADSCNPGASNANSASCGNCDYYLGSTCKTFQRGIDRIKASYGDNVCRDLGCTFEGKKYDHGETWCASAKGNLENLPGSRYFRMVCYNGDVLVEPCADYRQEICIQSDIDGFLTAACRANRWQDCNSQTKKKYCENKDKRDCKWIESGINNLQCVPEFAPGFNFWDEAKSESSDVCSKANVECTITCEKSLSGKEECESSPSGCGDEDGLSASWETKMNQVCGALGDCGVKKNYLGQAGFNEIGGED